MLHWLWKSALDGLKNPEWIAAIVLFIQAVILLRQTKLLGRHAETMEEHTKIAGAQAKTADSIGKALEQQGKILADQTKIMDEQFKFQRAIEIKAERVQVFDSLLQLAISFRLLLEKLLAVQLSNYTQEMQQQVQSQWSKMTGDFMECSKALHTSIHMDARDKTYFLAFVNDLAKLEPCSDVRKDIQSVKALGEKYKDLTARVFEAAKTRIGSS
jgi:hypothetical protein